MCDIRLNCIKVQLDTTVTKAMYSLSGKHQRPSCPRFGTGPHPGFSPSGRKGLMNPGGECVDDRVAPPCPSPKPASFTIEKEHSELRLSLVIKTVFLVL